MAQPLESARPSEYGACRYVANKLSAHLTYGRLNVDASGRRFAPGERVVPGSVTPSIEVHDYLYGVAVTWIKALDPKRRTWFQPWFPAVAAT